MRFPRGVVLAMALVALSVPVFADSSNWRARVIAAVQPGAVVARRGLDQDPITRLVLWGQGGGRWSHVGIAVQIIPDGPIYIESAMPGAGTVLETPEEFFSADQSSDGEVLEIPADKVDALQFAAKALLGRPFDNQLELDDGGQKLYCTKLVAFALRDAGVIAELPTRSIPWLPQKVITPDDLITAIQFNGVRP